MSSNWRKKGCLAVIILAVAFFLVAGGGTLYLNSQYAFLFTAPVVSHDEVFANHPGVRFILDPVKMKDLAVGALEDQIPGFVPTWVANYMLPHAAAVAFAADHERRTIPIQVFVNERRFGPPIAKQFNLLGFADAFPRITWASEGMVRQRPGVLTVDGSVPMDPEAQEDALMQWNPSLKRTPVAFEGGHLIEGVADNRDGGAFLVMASLMKAYDFNIDEQVDDVSLTTFLFVVTARYYVDLNEDDALVNHLEIEIVPEAKDRIAVVNLKAAIDRGLEDLTKGLQEEHNIAMTGRSEWHDNVMHFDYVVPGATKLFNLAVEGKLFPEDNARR